MPGTRRRDLLRHASMDLSGDRVRAWAKAARPGRAGAADLLEAYPERTFRCCCCGPTRTPRIRSRSPRAAEALPDAQLRVLPRTGFLIAYDDPGLARELVSFCG